MPPTNNSRTNRASQPMNMKTVTGTILTAAALSVAVLVSGYELDAAVILAILAGAAISAWTIAEYSRKPRGLRRPATPVARPVAAPAPAAASVAVFRRAQTFVVHRPRRREFALDSAAAMETQAK